MRPTLAITRPRAGAGIRAQSRWAARAARQASTKVAASPSRTSATTSEVLAGFVEVRRPPGASGTGFPSTTEPISVPDASVVMVHRTATSEPGVDDARSREVVERVAVEDHEVGEHAGPEPSSPLLVALQPRRSDDQRLERGLQVERLVRAPLAQDGVAQPLQRVHLLDRRVGAERQPGAARVQRAVRVRALEPVGPQPLGHRRVGHGHRGLDRGRDAELGEARDVVRMQALGVLDPRPDRVRHRGERVERLAVGEVADRVHGDRHARRAWRRARSPRTRRGS